MKSTSLDSTDFSRGVCTVRSNGSTKNAFHFSLPVPASPGNLIPQRTTQYTEHEQCPRSNLKRKDNSFSEYTSRHRFHSRRRFTPLNSRARILTRFPFRSWGKPDGTPPFPNAFQLSFRTDSLLSHYDSEETFGHSAETYFLFLIATSPKICTKGCSSQAHAYTPSTQPSRSPTN